MATVPPLSLSEVQRRYPHLFSAYSRLSDRESDAADDLGDILAGLPGAERQNKVDEATGLRLFIMGTDFSEPLAHSDKCPMKTESDANRYAIFVWKALSACESGSIGGDACREYDVLDAALDDALASSDAKGRFEHLLGWTAAAANHGLHSLLYRGEPERNRVLFKAAGDGWKKVFEADDGAKFVDEKLRSFAEWQCKYFDQILRGARKEYGDHARYTFNYIKKARVAKPAVAAAASAASVAAAASDQQKENAQSGAASEVTGPWEEEGWIPTTKAGKQKTPNVIRGELQRYIDRCKADGSKTQTKIIQEMGVNNNTFRRFMNPKTYKDQWSAVQNGTYWAAARLLARVKAEDDLAKKSTKRKPASASASGDGNAAKKARIGFPSKSAKEEVSALVDRALAVEGVTDSEVYDSCPQLVAKIKAFLARDGATKALLLRAFGGINSNSLGRFLAGKGQDQCANQAYRAAWTFFEKLRILEGAPKSKARIKNEAEQPGGFSKVKSRGGIWCYVNPSFPRVR